MTRRLNIITAACVAAIAMLLGACTSDMFFHDPDQEVQLTSSVAFIINDEAAMTRGVPVDNIRQLRDFRADAYLHRGGQAQTYFSNKRQFAASGAGIYLSDPAYFWPNEPYDTMSFVAVAPFDVAQNLNISTQGNFTYTVPANATDQCDLMQATARGVECPPPGVRERAPVPLNFKHLLTQVRFVFGANVSNYWRNLTVYSIRIENLSAAGTWDAAAGAWQNLDAQTNAFELTAPTEGIRRPYGQGEKEIWDKEYTMFLMPQILPTGARVAVDMSYQHSAASHEAMERRTYYLYLDGKKLEPGHTVTVEINSNLTGDCEILNTDGSDVELRPLSWAAQELSLMLARSGGADALTIKVAPECRSYASVSSGTSGNVPGSECDASGVFTLHIAENTAPSDRFIRLIIHTGHDEMSDLNDHYVVFKQRGFTSYGSFIDDPDYVDTPMPWGFNWPAPLKAVFSYTDPGFCNFEYLTINNELHQWVTKGALDFTLDYDILRTLVRRPNSTSDGLGNTRTINTSCEIVYPFKAVSFVWQEFSLYDDLTVGGVSLSGTEFENTYGGYNTSAVLEAIKLNPTGELGGNDLLSFVPHDALKRYLPAIEELETIAGSSSTPLLPGRTYWSSTVDTDGEPMALRINTDGSYTRLKPGADTQCYVHPVKTLQ